MSKAIYIYIKQKVDLLSAVQMMTDLLSFRSNEEEVGVAIQQSGIPREEIFVVTKV